MKKNEPNGRDIVLHREVLIDPALTWAEKVVISLIESLDVSAERGCQATNLEIAKMLGVREYVISQTVYRLVRDGKLSRFNWSRGEPERSLRWTKSTKRHQS